MARSRNAWRKTKRQLKQAEDALAEELATSNQAMVIVDNDNLRYTLRSYKAGLSPSSVNLHPNLTDVLLRVGDNDTFGITRVTQCNVFTTVANPKWVLPEETGLERRRPLATTLHSFPYPERSGVAGYEDELMWDEIVRSAAAVATRPDGWKVVIIVSSDWKAFAWARQIHEDQTGVFKDREAIVVYSHLNTATAHAQDPGNAMSLEEMFPVLRARFRDLRGYDPLTVAVQPA